MEQQHIYTNIAKVFAFLGAKASIVLPRNLHEQLLLKEFEHVVSFSLNKKGRNIYSNEKKREPKQIAG